MKELSLWEKILLYLRFTDSLGHNIFLVILFLFTSIFVYIILRVFLRRILNRDTHVQKSAGAFKVFLGLGFWLVAFPWALFLGIGVSLESASEAYALDEAFIYQLDGKPVAATVVEKCNAHSIENGVVYSSSSYKMQTIDLESGKIVFDHKLAKNGRFNTKLLCATRDNLFLFFDNRILVINKRTGKRIREIKSATQSGEVQLLPSPEMCKYDRFAKSIIFKANNGLVYSLDLASLTISEKVSMDPAKLSRFPR